MKNTFHGMINNLMPVQEAITRYMADHRQEQVHEFAVLKVTERPFSTIVFLRIVTNSGCSRLVMKTTKHNTINKTITEAENQSLVEFEILCNLYPKFAHIKGCAVPKPVLVLPEHETYIMEFVEGHLLADDMHFVRYFASKEGFANLMRHYFDVGRWLKHFHNFGGIRRGGVETLDDIISRCRQRLDLLVKTSAWRSDFIELEKQANAMLENQKKALKGASIPISSRHGDYGPWNILSTPNGICVIDFLGSKDDPIPVDILKVLVHLEDEKMSISSDKARIRSLQQSFLEGYGQIPDVPLPVILVCETMQRVVSIWGHVSNPKRLWHHRIEASRCIKNHCNWLMKDPKKISLWHATQ